MDLLGHGESQAQKGFGVKDSIHITSFVEREAEKVAPISAYEASKKMNDNNNTWFRRFLRRN